MSRSNGRHNAADSKAVEIVVNEDKHSEYNGSKLSTDTGLDMLLRPVAESGRAAGFVHQGDYRSENNKENDYSDVART